MISMSDICYEQIRDNYWYGQYSKFKVVINKSNGYINATKLCIDGGKQFKKWLAIHTLQHTHVFSNTFFTFKVWSQGQHSL